MISSRLLRHVALALLAGIAVAGLLAGTALEVQARALKSSNAGRSVSWADRAGPLPPDSALLVGTSLQQAALTAPTPQQGEYMGFAVALDGDTALVGAPGPTSLASGGAYIFVRSAGAWTLQATLTPDDGVAGDQFGVSVALDGDTAVVGSYYHTTARGMFSGSAYVFTRSGTTWTQQAKLAPDQGRSSDHFGNAVAVDSDTVVVGAIAQDVGSAVDAGRAYAFKRSAGIWTQEARFVLPDPATADDFGCAVAVDGNTALIGAQYRLLPGQQHPGAVYVYARSSGAWSLQQMLTAFTPQDGELFGCAVALDGDRALIGAERHDKWSQIQRGAAFTYTRANGIWSKEHLFEAADGSPGDSLGTSVALDGAMALVGTQDEPPYLFELNGGAWSEVAKLTSADAASTGRVALSGGTAVVGSPANPVLGLTNAGTAYVFVPDLPPVTTATVNPPLNAAGWTLLAPVTVTLSASAGTTAIDRTEYRQASAPAWIVYSEPFAILYQGLYTYEYRSFSVSGMYEMPKTLTVGIGWPDKPPVTTATVYPAPNAYGWNASPVTVTLAPTAATLAGIATTQYRLSGASTWRTYGPNPFSVSSRGTWTYEFRSTNLAGVAEDTKTVVVRIGARPRLTSLSPTSGRRGSTLTINGSGFGGTRGVSYVLVGGKKCSKYVAWSRTRVKVRVPSTASLGSVKVKLVTKVGGSNLRTFTVKR